MIRRDARQDFLEGKVNWLGSRASRRFKMTSDFGTTRASAWRYAREPVTGKYQWNPAAKTKKPRVVGPGLLVDVQPYPTRDLRREGLECSALLPAELVPIIDAPRRVKPAADAVDRVAFQSPRVRRGIRVLGKPRHAASADICACVCAGLC
jgi:hypothetical protein